MEEEGAPGHSCFYVFIGWLIATWCIIVLLIACETASLRQTRRRRIEEGFARRERRSAAATPIVSRPPPPYNHGHGVLEHSNTGSIAAGRPISGREIRMDQQASL